MPRFAGGTLASCRGLIRKYRTMALKSLNQNAAGGDKTCRCDSAAGTLLPPRGRRRPRSRTKKIKEHIMRYIVRHFAAGVALLALPVAAGAQQLPADIAAPGEKEVITLHA